MSFEYLLHFFDFEHHFLNRWFDWLDSLTKIIGKRITSNNETQGQEVLIVFAIQMKTSSFQKCQDKQQDKIYRLGEEQNRKNHRVLIDGTTLSQHIVMNQQQNKINGARCLWSNSNDKGLHIKL